MGRLIASARAAIAQRLHAVTHWLVFGVVVTLLWLAIPVQAHVALRLEATTAWSLPSAGFHRSRDHPFPSPP